MIFLDYNDLYILLVAAAAVTKFSSKNPIYFLFKIGNGHLKIEFPGPGTDPVMGVLMCNSAQIILKTRSLLNKYKLPAAQHVCPRRPMNFPVTRDIFNSALDFLQEISNNY